MTSALERFFRPKPRHPAIAVVRKKNRSSPLKNDWIPASQRIESLCAREIPLPLGRIIMMTALVLLSGSLGEIGLRITPFLLCAIRIATCVLVTPTTTLRQS